MYKRQANDGTGTITGYTALIDQGTRLITFLTPTVASNTTIYCRIGDGTDWTNWTRLNIIRQVAPPAAITITYGLTDTNGIPSGAALTLRLVDTLTGMFNTPPTTATNPYWYFQVPSDYALVSIKNAGFGRPIVDPNWVQEGTTGRYINRTAFVGYSGRYEIELRRV